MDSRFFHGLCRRWVNRPRCARRNVYAEALRHLAHDLRNPINSILLMAQLLEEAGESAEATRTALRIQRQCAELSRIVDRAAQSALE